MTGMAGKISRDSMWIAVIVMIIAITAGSSFADSGSATGELFVYSGGKMHVMNRVDSPSGERYESADDASTYFSSTGESAKLSIGGREITRYVLIRESQNEDRLILTADGVNYVMKQVVSASGAKYEALGDPTTVFWSKGPWAMLTIRGKEYDDYESWMESGGIWLADQDPPTGVEWKVESLNGEDIIEGSDVTVTFHPDRRVSGKASVNRYNAQWMKYGNRIIIGQGATTQMAGRGELMDQEDNFLRMLSNVVKFRLQRDELTLITKDDEEIVLTK
ncbi:MAG: META domain-containing protein [Synergistaceae bacterium]|jgi:heat shock protein HslJ|nr:META domain-containing protein [Synergistaceae bacterium]